MEIHPLVEARENLIYNPPVLNLDRTVQYRQGFALAVPRRSGIYLLHDMRGVFYAGKSEDLRRRFDEHFFERANPRLSAALNHPVGETMFSWQEVDMANVNVREQQLIRAFYPLCNRRFYQST